jgi:hypothetical protein
MIFNNRAEPGSHFSDVRTEPSGAKVPIEEDRGEAGPTKISADIRCVEGKNYFAKQFFFEIYLLYV